MPYTNEQKKYYNTKPTLDQVYSTITLSNDVVGTKRILAADSNGPYKSMRFNDGGSMEVFEPVLAEVPKVSAQDTTSNEVGQIKLSGIAFEVNELIEQIAEEADTFDKKVIRVKLSNYKNPSLPPMYEIDVFVGIEGISIGDFDVVMKLQFSNPAKVAYAPFYNPFEYEGLLYE